MNARRILYLVRYYAGSTRGHAGREEKLEEDATGVCRREGILREYDAHWVANDAQKKASRVENA